jgi:hypothetical protein
MLRVYRLITLMLAGGYAGLVTFGLLYAQAPDTFGFSVAEYQRWSMIGILTGMFAGIGVEFIIRLLERPHLQFSIRELLITITLVAVGLVTIAALLEWAKFSV